MNARPVPRSHPAGRAWAPLDNAAIIFLAARTDADPKVFRLSAELDHDVDPVILQEALDATYDLYPLYHAVLRPGVFWYYLQDSDLRPFVTLDEQPVCAPLYRPGRRTLLFRVVHHRRRIVLETFHALSDGTGALWFLSDLVAAYVRLRHPDGVDPRAAGGAAPGLPGAPVPARAAGARPERDLTGDSYSDYFRRRRMRSPSAPETSTGAAAPVGWAAGGATRASRAPLWVARVLRVRGARVHQVTGTRTPDNRPRTVELTVPTADVVALARAEGVSLTMYLTALFFESVRASSGGLGRAATLSASVPVNLRRFFPSTSARNFFAVVRVEHTYAGDPEDLGTICRLLEAQFRARTTPAALAKRVRRLVWVEEAPIVRIVPRLLKDGPLGVIGRATGRGFTVAVSNLGRVVLPGPAEARVGRMLFHVSAVRPQFCVISHAGLLTISFTSPFIETDHIREFARALAANGVKTTVAMARATEDELAEVGR